MSNRVESRVININHPPIDGKRWDSFARKGAKWGAENYRIGARSVNLLSMSFIFGAVADWLCVFQNNEDNKIVSFASNLLNGVADSLFGKRDEDMYEGIYARGMDEVSSGNLSEDDLKDQKKILQKVPMIDDAVEMEHFLKDKVISKLWKWTLGVSRIEAPLYFASAFLGNKVRNVVFCLTQTMSRTLWRTSFFFPNAFHKNFVETACKLTFYKLMSFSQVWRDKYKLLRDEVDSMARKYFEEVPGGENKLEGKTGISAYVCMLRDRMRQHYEGIRNPGKVLEDKVRRKELERTIRDEKNPDASKAFERGFTDPANKKDQNSQTRISIVDLTAPVCAAVGLIGSLVFEPLRYIWDLAGFEKGKGVISAIGSSRGLASLVNYYFKFFIPENQNGSDCYKELEKGEKGILSGNANEAVKHLHRAMKTRYVNSIMGKGMLVGSIIETALNLIPSTLSESKGAKFFHLFVSRFVGTGFSGYFSCRREGMGLSELVECSAKELLGGKDVVTLEDIKNIPKSEDQRFLEIMESIGKIKKEQYEEPERIKIYDPLVGWFNKIGDIVTERFSLAWL